MVTSTVLKTLYQRLYTAYGPQHWWPAETPFEVMVGAVLTQNTAWINVEKAIANLQTAGKLELAPMQRMTEKKLAQLIRPAGYFNVKARRLKNLCHWLKKLGGIEELSLWTSEELRTALLEVNGIGPETADDILLYAFERPVFVIDTYTRRLIKRLGLINGEEDYEVLRTFFESALDPEPAIYNEYHALIVRHAKEKCCKDLNKGRYGKRSSDNVIDCRHCQVELPIE